MAQKVKGKRTLKNGAVAGYVLQKDGKYLWRIIGRSKTQAGGWGGTFKLPLSGGGKQTGGWGMLPSNYFEGKNKNKNQSGGWGMFIPIKNASNKNK